MPRFFVPGVGTDTAVVTGQDARHIALSLRMTAGDRLTLCDGRGTDYFSEITAVAPEQITLKVLYHTPTACEPDTAVTLYQGLPKGEKMEWIVQKSVELGVTRIVPVVTARSIVRLKPGEGAKKAARWSKIAAEAAGQSGRGILPEVEEPISFPDALVRLSGTPTLLCYEGGGVPLAEAIPENTSALSLVIGPEGGFEPTEAEALQAGGATLVTLGKRILRCETAPLAALTLVMGYTGNMD